MTKDMINVFVELGYRMNLNNDYDSLIIKLTQMSSYIGDRPQTLIFGFEQTDIKHQTQKPFTKFTKLFIEQTRTSFFRTSNGLERVHLLLIELKHPIFGFEGSNIELQT